MKFSELLNEQPHVEIDDDLYIDFNAEFDNWLPRLYDFLLGKGTEVSNHGPYKLKGLSREEAIEILFNDKLFVISFWHDIIDMPKDTKEKFKKIIPAKYTKGKTW